MREIKAKDKKGSKWEAAGKEKGQEREWKS